MSRAKRIAEFETTAQVARPVMFEGINPQFPYWGKGTSLILADAKHYYWVTAQHVVDNAAATYDQLRIYPSDDSRMSLPFNTAFRINSAGAAEDFHDLVVARIDLETFADSGDAPLVAQDLHQGLLPTEELRRGDELWIVGYPAERSEIDYDAAHISRTRTVLRAQYLGESSTRGHIHTVQVSSSIRLDSFDGLSGSPIFRLVPHPLTSHFLLPKIAGMLINGTASSGLAHFIGAGVIKAAIDEAERR